MQIVERCDYHVGDVISSRYRVERLLGEGTFGIVYKVTDQKNGGENALKILKLWAIPIEERELLIKRFDREYETGLIKSDYLVHTRSKGETKGNPFIVMDFCPGGDLQNAVRKHAIDISIAAKEILHGLHDLHSNGKVHRDLKPENVLIGADGKAMLTDFGIAGDQNNRLTRMGIVGIPKQIFGTFAYMPPEQANPRRGNATVLPTTDIFSFGVMMYEMLVGVLPFGPLETERDLPAYVYNGKNGKWNREPITRINNGNGWLYLLERCLDPDFSSRIQSAAEAIKIVPESGLNHKYIPGISSSNDSWSHTAVNGILLRIMEGEEYGRVCKLNDMLNGIICRVITMGRKSDTWRNIIDLKEEESHFVSRKQCTLEWNNQKMVWIIRDGQWDLTDTVPSWKPSLNGTYLNSSEVDTQGAEITPGDIITVGDIKIRVEGY